MKSLINSSNFVVKNLLPFGVFLFFAFIMILLYFIIWDWPTVCLFSFSLGYEMYIKNLMTKKKKKKEKKMYIKKVASSPLKSKESSGLPPKTIFKFFQFQTPMDNKK